jgi:molybdopterin-guanine dinucleotide biosynthesis protein A
MRPVPRMPPHDSNLSDVALAVLAGGEASRMGYPKGEIRLHGRPVLEVLLERFAWPGPTLLVTAPGREHPTGWQAFTREVVDPSAGQGPLRGLLTALENSPVPWVVATAVDMPLVRHDQLQWMATALKRQPAVLGLMLWQGSAERRRLQPFPSAFQVNAAPFVRRQLESNRRSLHGLLDDPGVIAVDAPVEWGDRTWMNVNFPEDLHSIDPL